ncbi:TPA: hypothetical protein ACR3S6_004468 [Bacillus thuringiensis]
MSNKPLIELRSIIPYIIHALKKIRKLSAGVNNLHEAAPYTVPQQDMEAALMLAEGIEDTLLKLKPRLEIVRKGWTGSVDQMMYVRALSGAQGIRRTLATQLERAAGTNIKSVNIRTLLKYEYCFHGTQDFLRVMSGEIAWNDSYMGGSVNAEYKEYINYLNNTTKSLIPVISPIYDINDEITGIRLPDVQNLSNLDRILKVFFSPIHFLLRVITNGGYVTPKLIRTYSKVSSVKYQKLAMAVALNKMSPNQIKHFSAVIKVAQLGAKLTDEQQIVLNKLLVGMNQTGVAVAWAKIADNPLNTDENLGSAIVFKDVNFKEGEREAITVLTQKMDKASIIALPDSLPEYLMGKRLYNSYKLKEKVNVRYPDLVIENILADIYTPTANNFNEIIKSLKLKNSQASMIVLNMDKSPLSPGEVVKQMGRFWGEMQTMMIDRVIVLDSKGFFENLIRPIPFQITDLGLFPDSSLSDLKKHWDELEDEE